MSTTKAKDILDNATNVPTTAPDKENEDRDVELEHKYIIQVKDDTIDNNEVWDNGYIKVSKAVSKIQTQFRLEKLIES